MLTKTFGQEIQVGRKRVTGPRGAEIMKLFYFLSDKFSKTVNFVQRAWTYRAWLSTDKDFDWYWLAWVMELKLRRMSSVLANGYHVTREQDAKECQIAAHILYRLRMDIYTVPQMRNKVPENDARLLGRLIGRKMRCWWD